MKKLVEIKNLVTQFKIGKRWAKAVRGVDLDIYEGETLGVVGESGSGKSVSVLSLIQLIPNPPGEVSDGDITFKGDKLFNGKEYNDLKKLPKFKFFNNLIGYPRHILAIISSIIWIYSQSLIPLSFLSHAILYVIVINLIVKLFYSSPYNDALKSWRKNFYSKMHKLRGDEIAMIFQEPMTSLNPVFTIGFQIIESIRPLSLIEYLKNWIINSSSTIKCKSNDMHIKVSIISGIIILIVSQLTLGWTFKLFDIIKFFILGGLLPIIRSTLIVILDRLIAEETKTDFKKLFKEGTNLLERVGIPDPHLRMKDYPHQFSGGMRQRAMIAMALAKNPSLLIADEPTTALDVTIQAQILNLMVDLKRKNENSAVVLITHDLAVVAETCERVVVMYGGMIQEIASVKELFSNPLHPYTHGLLKSIPRPDRENKKNRLEIIEGMVPSILDMPIGCKFCTRCDIKIDICDSEEPPLIDMGNNHFVRCHAVDSIKGKGQ